MDDWASFQARPKRWWIQIPQTEFFNLIDAKWRLGVVSMDYPSLFLRDLHPNTKKNSSKRKTPWCRSLSASELKRFWSWSDSEIHRELTYPPKKMHCWVDDFPFPQETTCLVDASARKARDPVISSQTRWVTIDGSKTSFQVIFLDSRWIFTFFQGKPGWWNSDFITNAPPIWRSNSQTNSWCTFPQFWSYYFSNIFFVVPPRLSIPSLENLFSLNFMRSEIFGW